MNWFNNIRIHGSLDYLTPMEYKHKHQTELSKI
ncbi:IS3 family transposase [Ornithinibacillus gellani]